MEHTAAHACVHPHSTTQARQSGFMYSTPCLTAVALPGGGLWAGQACVWHPCQPLIDTQMGAPCMEKMHVSVRHLAGVRVHGGMRWCVGLGCYLWHGSEGMGRAQCLLCSAMHLPALHMR